MGYIEPKPILTNCFNLLGEEPGPIYEKISEEPVHDGCILCGMYKGWGYKFLYENLCIYGGVRRICPFCWRSICKERELIETTFHEAGHTVACLAYGRKFDYVTNMDLYSLGNLGHMKFRGPLARNPDKINFRNFHAVKARLVIDFAGDAAVEILYGPAYTESLYFDTLDIDAQSDYREYLDISAKHPGFIAYFNRFQSFAVALLKCKWHQVVTIANALLYERKLNYDRCVQLLNQS